MFLFFTRSGVTRTSRHSSRRFLTSKGTEAISAMHQPHNVSSFKCFLGMIGYFPECVRNMSSRTKHLHSHPCKGTPFVWTDVHDAEFADLKAALISPYVMLYHSDFTCLLICTLTKANMAVVQC